MKTKFICGLLSVKDIDESVKFYKKVLGLRVVTDFGANKTLTGGLALQTEETWQEFIGNDKQIKYRNNDAEFYFEIDDLDAFVERLQQLDVKYVHPLKEHGWGQRVVRIYDPDGHILEIGETLNAVAHRFFLSGMSTEQIAERMGVPTAYVTRLLAK